MQQRETRDTRSPHDEGRSATDSTKSFVLARTAARALHWTARSEVCVALGRTTAAGATAAAAESRTCQSLPRAASHDHFPCCAPTR